MKILEKIFQQVILSEAKNPINFSRKSLVVSRQLLKLKTLFSGLFTPLRSIQIDILKFIIFLFFIGLGLVSCSDVINSDENLNKILISDKVASDDSLKNLSFTKIDSNNYTSSYIFDLTDSKYPVRKELKLTLFNKSAKDTITIYSLKLKYNNKGFYIRYNKKLPIFIYPNSFIDSASTVFLGIALDKKSTNVLLDSLIFNDSQRFRASLLALLGK